VRSTAIDAIAPRFHPGPAAGPANDRAMTHFVKNFSQFVSGKVCEMAYIVLHIIDV
jgi:hypothetical protein